MYLTSDIELTLYHADSSDTQPPMGNGLRGEEYLNYLLSSLKYMEACERNSIR